MNAIADCEQKTLHDYIRDLRTDVYGLAMIVASAMHKDEEQPSAIALCDRMLATLNRIESQEAHTENSAATTNTAPIPAQRKLFRADINGAWVFWTNQPDGLCEVIESMEHPDLLDEVCNHIGWMVQVPEVIPSEILDLAMIARFGDWQAAPLVIPPQKTKTSLARTEYVSPDYYKIAIEPHSYYPNRKVIEITQGFDHWPFHKVEIADRGKVYELECNKRQILWLLQQLGARIQGLLEKPNQP